MSLKIDFQIRLDRDCLIKPFLANAPILYPLKTPGHL